MNNYLQNTEAGYIVGKYIQKKRKGNVKVS